MRRKIWFVSALAGIALFACNEKKETAEVKAAPKEKVNCLYSLKETEVKWTAFKFTDKAAVGGAFDSLTLVAPEQSIEPILTLKNASVVINTKSVNSNLPVRDERLARVFFGSLAEDGMIKAMVKSIESTGEGTLVIVFNGIEKEIPFKAEYGEGLSLKSSIQFSDFNAQASADALNAECKDLHKGKDGKAVLWPEVNLEATFTLDEQCG